MIVELLWYSGNEFFSQLIRFGQSLTGSRNFRDYTHVAIRIGENVYESLTDQGVRVHRGDEAWRRAAEATARYALEPIQEDDGERAIAWLDDQVGDRYAFLEIFFVALDQIFPWIPVSVAIEDTFICSALVAFALLILGTEHQINKRDPRLQTPASLAHIYFRGDR